MQKRLAAAILGLLLSAGCAPTDSVSPSPADHSAIDAATCTQQGGTLKPVCRRQTPRCVMPYADAGKTCTDGSQCAGDCLLEGDAAPGAPATGRCQADDDPCGCKTPIVDGKVGAGRCVD